MKGNLKEKEEITLAYSAAKANKGDKVAELVTADELNAELDKINSLGEASGSEQLTVTFSETQRQYIIDQSTGKIMESVEKEIEDCNDYVLRGSYYEGDWRIIKSMKIKCNNMLIDGNIVRFPAA